MPRALIPGLFILVLLTLFPAQAWTQELRLQAQQAQPVPGGDYNGAVFVEGAALPPPVAPHRKPCRASRLPPSGP